MSTEIALTVLLPGVVAWVLTSERLGRVSVTAPLLMTLLGLGFVLLPVTPDSITGEPGRLRLLVELTLAVILFVDASHIGARWFGDPQARLALRLLGIGLPLTVLAGLGAAWALFPGVSLALLGVVAAALAPTDAALGASVMADERIPLQLRQVINVESGLNDGLVTPVVLALIALAVAEEDSASLTQTLAHAVVQIVVAVLVGAVVGTLGGRLMLAADRRGWSLPEQEPIATLALALLAYVSALLLGGNGFVAAFVAGVAFGTAVARARPPEVMVFADRTGLLLSFVVWFLFGAALLRPAFDSLSLAVVAYAVLSLTIVRMVPVALSLIGSRLSRDDVLLLGWLGPRGLASIVFALIAMDEIGGEAGHQIADVVTVTVVLSVILHGLSAGPLATWYARRHPMPAASQGPGVPTDGVGAD